MSLKLTHDYSLSPVEAKTLTQDIRLQMDNNHKLFIHEGQVLYTAVMNSEPAGKALKDCRTKQICLNVYPTELIETFFKDHQAYNKLMVQRLSWEAMEQLCNLTQEDLARLLHCSVSTIRRIIAQYRQEGIFIPTRGNYSDIGPGLSHKYEAVKRFLKGYTISEIARAMSHDERSVERYVDDFTMVYVIYVHEPYSSLRISRMLRLSEKLVAEYISLYDQFKNDDDCHHRLEQLKMRASLIQQRSQKKREIQQ